MTIQEYKLEAWQVKLKISQRFSWIPVILNNKKISWLRSYWIVHSDYQYNKFKERTQFSRVIYSSHSQEECENQINQVVK